MESNFGLAAFLHVALELVNDFVLLLVPLVFGLDGLDIGAIVGCLDLFLKR